MCTFNLVNRSANNQLLKAKNQGLGVIIKSPMAHQVFNKNIYKINDITSLWYFLRIIKNYKSQLIKGFKFRFIDNVDGMSSSQIALKFVLDNSCVDVAIIGTTKLKHLNLNIDATYKTIPDEIRQKLIELY
tara:strand:- start:245 stop:637 length:393 start_codon:yes stop_codon:yes gene_type:complete